MLTLYGISASRAMRNLWLLEELGLDYRHEAVDYRQGGAATPEMLARNANGRIPVLDDDGLLLYESMAINLYLADRYGRDGDNPLWPADPAGRGLCYQWSFWVMTEVEQALLTTLMHKRVLPAEHRDPDKLARSLGLLQRPFAVLEQALAGRDWLVGGAFSVADLNVAAVLGWARAARVDLAATPRLAAWLKTCTDRPAFRTALRRP